jgi:hypothetical protein
MQEIKPVALGASILGLIATTAMGQIAVDIITGPDLSTLQQHLYSSLSVPAPVGTEVWFVADGGPPGIPTGPITKETVDDIVAGTGNDQLMFTLTIDGNQPLVHGPGRLWDHSSGYALNFQGKPVDVYLWSDSHGGDVGDTFGVLQLTTANGRIISPSSPGDAFQFLINSDILANTFTVVPEPGQYASIFAFLCLGVVALRAIRSKKVSRL